MPSGTFVLRSGRATGKDDGLVLAGESEGSGYGLGKIYVLRNCKLLCIEITYEIYGQQLK